MEIRKTKEEVIIRFRARKDQFYCTNTVMSTPDRDRNCLDGGGDVYLSMPQKTFEELKKRMSEL